MCKAGSVVFERRAEVFSTSISECFCARWGQIYVFSLAAVYMELKVASGELSYPN